MVSLVELSAISASSITKVPVSELASPPYLIRSQTRHLPGPSCAGRLTTVWVLLSNAVGDRHHLAVFVADACPCDNRLLLHCGSHSKLDCVCQRASTSHQHRLGTDTPRELRNRLGTRILQVFFAALGSECLLPDLSKRHRRRGNQALCKIAYSVMSNVSQEIS